MENYAIESIGSYVRGAMKLFGIEVNTKRQLPSIYDGLKPAYRHIIVEELRTGTQMRKSTDIAGSCMSTTHGHGDASLEDPISNLVRWGISKGQGNHGKKLLIGEDALPSAMRYTEARLSDKYINIFSDFMPYVPYIPSEVKGTEPKYLPTIFPLCLTFGSLGIGLGANCRIPCFTMKSMLDAFLNDDPQRLEAPFGMIIDKSKSELDELWRTGVGKICYKFNVYSTHVEGNYGFMLEGNPEFFKPDMTLLSKYEDSGKVIILDQTDKTGPKIFVARDYNVKSLSHSEIEDMLLEAAQKIRTYRLTVAKDDEVFLIPLKEWLKFTYDQYIDIINRYKKDKVNKLEFQYIVQENSSNVLSVWKDSDFTLSPQELADKTGLDIDVIESILSRSLRSFAKKDNTNKLEKIRADINFYSGIEPTDKVKEMINEF